MDSPYKALQVLLASEDRLDPIFAEIESLNTERKTSTEHFVLDALKMIDTTLPALFYDSTQVSHGILGLIAGRLCEAYHKPAIAMREENGMFVGSCRSPEYCPIAEIFESLRDCFVAFGGHDQAAGFTIKKEFFSVFQQRFIALVQAQSEQVSRDRFHVIDFPLALDSIRPDNLFSLDQLHPFGIGNKKPLFYLTDLA
jgi:single-stranded-DNA-specific exonuclease